MSEFLLRNRNRIIGSAMAIGLTAGVGTGIYEICDQQSTSKYDATAALPCNTLPQQQVDAMAKRLHDDFAIVHNRAEAPPTDFSPLYAGNMLGAARLNLHLAAAEMPTITPHMNGDQAATLLNDFTAKEYGFTVTAHTEKQETAADATNLEHLLARIPTELVKAAHLSSIEIDGDLLPGEAGNFNPDTDAIRFAAGQTDSIGHELDHALAKQSAIKHCGSTVSKLGDPNLIAANPPGFSYDSTGQDIAWQRTTATRYGAYSSAEDGAEVSFEMMEPSTDTCIYGRSPALDTKDAIVAARFQDLVPGTGTFVIDALAVSRACM